MTHANEMPFPDDGEPTVFAAVMAPHRSLSRKGFFIVMLAMGGISFACGLFFLALGAWPIFGFFGLDVALLYWAFKANFKAAAAREYIRITPSLIQVRHVPARGAPRDVEMNPFFTRLWRRDVEEFGTLDMALESRGRRTPVGIHLGPHQKSVLAADLTSALSEVKRGVTRSVF